jgi:hypothetical protein
MHLAVGLGPRGYCLITVNMLGNFLVSNNPNTVKENCSQQRSYSPSPIQIVNKAFSTQAKFAVLTRKHK